MTREDRKITKAKSCVTYNCIHCEKYWQSFTKIFNSMGDEIEFIELHCPSCRRVGGFW